jgi:hypothetical protein
MYLRLSVRPLLRCDVHDMSDADGCAAVWAREERVGVDVGGKKVEFWQPKAGIYRRVRERNQPPSALGFHWPAQNGQTVQIVVASALAVCSR